MWIRRAEILGRGLFDVRLARGRIAELAPAGGAHSRAAGAVDAAGGALLPGLHDHHLHLLALAAALSSVACGPPAVRDARELARALANARPGRDGWIRGVGYHETVAGALDRAALDSLTPARPVRIQHRSGALWMLNSAAVRALKLDAPVASESNIGARVRAGDDGGVALQSATRASGMRGDGVDAHGARAADGVVVDRISAPDGATRAEDSRAHDAHAGADFAAHNNDALHTHENSAAHSARTSALPAGVLRDARGRVTGRLLRADAWLRARLRATQSSSRDATPAPDLARVGRVLSRCGVTGVTDATPHNGASEVALVARAHAAGALPQRVVWMGGAALPPAAHGEPSRAWKLVLDEAAAPTPDALAAHIARAHGARRAVAIHCVTRATLVLACAALEAAGARAGDRIEHASVAPPELLPWLARLGVCVVTQPNFVYERGDEYCAEVEARERTVQAEGLAQSVIVTSHVALGSLLLAVTAMIALLSFRWLQRPSAVAAVSGTALVGAIG